MNQQIVHTALGPGNISHSLNWLNSELQNHDHTQWNDEDGHAINFSTNFYNLSIQPETI